MKNLIIALILVAATAACASPPTGTVTRTVSVYTNGVLVDTNFAKANGILQKTEPIEGYHPEIAISRDRTAKAFMVTGTTAPDITGSYVDIGTYAGHTLYSNVTRLAIAFWRTDDGRWYIVATNNTIFGVGIPVWSSYPPYDAPDPWDAHVYQDYQWNGSTGTPSLVDTSTWRTNTAESAYTTNHAVWHTNQVLGISGTTNTLIYLGAP